MSEPSFAEQVSSQAVKIAPPAVVSLYAAVSKGLPFVISFLTLVYLSIQIAHLLWKWGTEIQRKRDVDRALRGRPADYQPSDYKPKRPK